MRGDEVMKASIKSKLILLLLVKALSSPCERSLMGFCMSPGCWLDEKNILSLRKEEYFGLDFGALGWAA